MARIPTTPSIILTAVVDRIHAAMGYNSETCFLADPENEIQPSPSDRFITIWFDGGDFDLEAIAGGVPFASMIVTATIWTAILTDQAGKDEKLLGDSARGLLTTMHKLFKSLFLHDLAVGLNQILQHPLRPTSFGPAQKKMGRSSNLSGITKAWAADFEWDQVT